MAFAVVRWFVSGAGGGRRWIWVGLPLLHFLYNAQRPGHVIVVPFDF
jgi:hypothetical protein